MAQPTLSDFIVTPASNTDFNSVGILGMSLVSTADDAFRTLASMLKSGVQTGYTTVATAAGTTVLTANSNSYQYATGVTTQTYTMPTVTAAGMELGRTFTFVNNSTGALTINSSGGNLIATVASGDVVTVQCILITGTTAASWAYNTPLLRASTASAGVAAPVFELFRNDRNDGIDRGSILFTTIDNAAAKWTIASLATQTTNSAATHMQGELVLKIQGQTGASSSALQTVLTVTGRTTPSPAPVFDFQDSSLTTTGAVSGGSLAATGQLIISGAAAGQIVFPATQNPSANANTLDDYEEGTGTPGMTFNASATGVTYGLQTETYTKIGNRVFYDISLTLTSNGSGVGTALVTGLVFTSAAGEQFAAAYLPVTGFSGLTAGINGEVSASATTITVRFPTTTGSTTATDTNVTDTAAFRVSGHYGT